MLAKGLRTLYPPTEDQFEALVAFLLADPSHHGHVECPLPIHRTRLNRPRWEPIDSMRFHIFSDQYERRITPKAAAAARNPYVSQPARTGGQLGHIRVGEGKTVRRARR